MDPVTGAATTRASFGAWKLAEQFTQHDGPLDVGFAELDEDAVRPRSLATVGCNDLVLAPPDYFVGLLMEMSTNHAMCDEFTEGFANPEHLWFDITKDPDMAAAFASSHH